ncbi:coA-transferase III family protein [Mycobacterium xenopi 4042]|uniref:CoA-transferase III family protein n=1 Tax=Mycobacterium xenopi 4042 TaxID=1299334 RepID=X7Z9V7_MYCXE|nr:coA-transferase III family protein [Mycobacterium xenopi 4042]
MWLRIKGYNDQPDRVAFGDDAAVAGGLVGADADGPVFCGDAIADPLTGLEATRAVAQSLHRGGGELIELSLAAVAATYAALPLESSESSTPIAPPQPPPPSPPRHRWAPTTPRCVTSSPKGFAPHADPTRHHT